MFEPLSELAGKPRAKEKFPVFKSAMLKQLAKERPEIEDHKSSSSEYVSEDENKDDLNNQII
tara:strand:+ start:467 stop:652 length:186 start_codon:yes stop_codon:yes gene_type:complete